MSSDDQALVARAAALLHANGESTSVTLAAVDRLGRGLGTGYGLIPTWTSTTVISDSDDPVITPVSPTGVAMGAVTVAMRAVDGVAEGSVDRGGLGIALDRAAAVGASPLWLFVLACATGPAALSVIFGAHDTTAVLLVAVSGALGGLLRRGLGRVRVGIIGQVFAAALLAGIFGGAAVNADLSSALRLIAVCPAMILVPGPHILNGVLDLLSLRVSLGLARLGYAALVLLAIGGGLTLALALFGTDLPVEPAGRSVPLWLDVIAAAVAASSYAVYLAMPYRLIVYPAVIGAVAHGLRTWALEDQGANIAIGAAVACLLVGVVMAPLAHRLRVPYAAVAFAAVVSLIPGVYVFRMLNALGQLAFGATSTDFSGIIFDGSTAVLIVLGMAVGLAVPKQIHDRLVRS